MGATVGTAVGSGAFVTATVGGTGIVVGRATVSVGAVVSLQLAPGERLWLRQAQPPQGLPSRTRRLPGPELQAPRQVP